MKLEKLKLLKFKESVLKREQLMQLNGGGIATGAGHISDWATGECLSFDYGYDSMRDGSYGYGGDYGTYQTYHNRTNVTKC
ncbi:hypothetical protein [Flavobacterium sp. Root420]|uniref:hypothetical protein n=1 Tax=Flavobacterium sp. Root420 TaxID=1736533 RepID=UPI0006F7F635|nr:hypothetical protein [Flavobacterium sp. Root420]KQX10218.1 hypothetical protein ASC72_21285 [Flavobacterium sp. Root420]